MMRWKFVRLELINDNNLAIVIVGIILASQLKFELFQLFELLEAIFLC